MNIEILKEEYSRKMEKALRRGEFALFDEGNTTDSCKLVSKSRQKQSPTP